MTRLVRRCVRAGLRCLVQTGTRGRRSQPLPPILTPEVQRWPGMAEAV